MDRFEEEVHTIIKEYGNIGFADVVELKRKYCLDKQRVRDVLKKYKEVIGCCHSIEEELGLDEKG